MRTRPWGAWILADEHSRVRVPDDVEGDEGADARARRSRKL